MWYNFQIMSLLFKRDTITAAAIRQAVSLYVAQYKKHKLAAVCGIVLPAIGTICIMYTPPLIVSKIVDLYVATGTVSTQMYTYVAIFGGLWLVGEILWRVGMHFLIRIESVGMQDLAQHAFKKLAHRDYDFYTNNFVGSLTKKTSAFAARFETFTDTLSFNVLNNIFPALFAFVVLWSYSPIIAIVLIGCLAIAISIAIPIIRLRAKLVAERHEANSKMAGRLSDILTNILAVKSFAKEDAEFDTYKSYVDDASYKFKRAADYQNLRFDMTISPLYITTNVIGLLAAIFFATSLQLTAGMIMVVFAYYAAVTRIFWDINRTYRHLEAAIGEASEFTQMFLDEPEVVDVEKPGMLTIQNSNIQFKNVNFAYGTEKESKFAFENFNLNIQGQQKIGLVGPSGGGKTTITKLLLRFINIQQGIIAIDGQNIADVSQSSLRDKIAYVPQEPLLFHRSLFENIAYSKPDATLDEVIHAAKLAHAHEFIESLPQGYETMVGERGIKLSGGQRQRIAIARAILKNAPILILDEATSALDSESEKYIQAGLKELMKNKTALVIAHRLSTIKHLDRVIVLTEGKIVQDGTHESLRNQKGMYANLWGHQSGEFLAE